MGSPSKHTKVQCKREALQSQTLEIAQADTPSSFSEATLGAVQIWEMWVRMEGCAPGPETVGFPPLHPLCFHM